MQNEEQTMQELDPNGRRMAKYPQEFKDIVAEEHAKGTKLKKIAAIVNRAGVRTKSGKKISTPEISYMAKYLGHSPRQVRTKHVPAEPRKSIAPVQAKPSSMMEKIQMVMTSNLEDDLKVELISMWCKR